jgi:circadian clock protein KaiC
MDEKLTTGIEQLDTLLEGGLYVGSNILIRGGPGTGKTTMGLQYLVSGSRLGEKTVYMTFEESREQIMRYGMRFFPDISQLEKDERIKILDFSPQKKIRGKMHTIDGKKVEIPDSESVDSVSYIEERIKDIRGQSIRRVVIDGLQTFATAFYDMSEIKDMDELRRTMSQILVMLKESKATTYVLSEESESSPNKYDFVNYAVDGVMSLKSNPSLDVRTIRVEKLRGIKHTLKPLTIELIDSGGISVVTSQKGI